jgi:gliding motility-associated-like protein
LLVISGTATQTGTFTYTIVASGGCASKTTTGVITIHADNTYQFTSAQGTDAQELCINTPINTITYTITGATGATFVGLPEGVTGTYTTTTNGLVTDTVLIISGVPTQAGLFNYAAILTGGCNDVRAVGTLYVKINSINLTSPAGTDNQVKCINTPIDSIQYKTVLATGATVSGLPNGVIAAWSIVNNNNVIDSILVITGTPLEAGTFTYTISLLGGCDQTPVTKIGIINVSPETVAGNLLFTEGGSPICNLGDKPTVSIVNNIGDVIAWQKSILNEGPYQDIAGVVGVNLKDSINNIASGTVSVITYYRAAVKSGACAIKYSNNIFVEVKPTPYVTSIKGDTICGSGSLTLKAETNLGIPYWYFSATTDSVVAGGNLFITPYLDSTTSIYVGAYFNGCFSPTKTEVRSVFKYVPEIVAINNGESCGPGSMELVAIPSKGFVNWYETATGGVPVNTGEKYTTPKVDSTTKYFVDATFDGCTTKERRPVFAIVHPLPIATPLSDTPRICVGKGIYLENKVSGGKPPYEFYFTVNNSVVNTTNYGKIIGASQGLATVNYKVKDLLGCFSNTTSDFIVKVDTAMRSREFFQEAYFDYNTVILTKTDSAYTKYAWTPMVHLDSYDKINPTFRWTADQTYYLRRTDSVNQCDVIDIYNITVTKDHILTLPNAFTPNGDGLNDDITIFKNAGILDFHYLKIFNRYGKLVFQTTDIIKGWNGKIGDQLQALDSYFWTAEFVTKENKVVQNTGTFLLLN